jgi:hypothetical protein
MIDTSMKFLDLHEMIVKKASQLGMTIRSLTLKYNVNGHNGGKEHIMKYPLIRLDRFSKNQDILFLVSGFHGYEKAGPLTFANHLEDIVAMSEKKGIGLIMVPIVNPTGFELGRRYNIVTPDEAGNQYDGVKPQNFGPNNDFIRYLVKHHKLVDDLRNRRAHTGWLYSNDPSIVENLPHETIKMHQLIKKIPRRQIKGILDIHQDMYAEEMLSQLKDGKFSDMRWTYAYIYSNKKLYLPIMQEAAKVVPYLSNSFIDTGYKKITRLDENGTKKVETVVNEKDKVYSDSHGFVYRHDGSITDLMYRLKVPYVVALETSGKTPIEEADKVNMIWIEGMMDLMQQNQLKRAALDSPQ